MIRANSIRSGLSRRWREEKGFALIELLVASSLMIVVLGATLYALSTVTSGQSRGQAYANEVSSTQAAMSRLIHDLRQATAVTFVGPGLLLFQMQVGGTAYNVRYDCSASDSLGAPYRRCARTSAPAPSQAPLAGSQPGPDDILHVYNNPSTAQYATFCNTAGTAQSGSVFFPTNPGITNNDGLNLACDEAYEGTVSGQPTFIQVQVEVPASGDLTHGGLKHLTVLSTGTFLPNQDAGA